MGLAARRVTCKNDICMVYRMATPTFLNRQLMYRNAGAGRKGRAIEFVYTTYHNIECTIAAAIQICSCNPMAATTAQTHPTNNNLHTSTKRSTRSATPPRKAKKIQIVEKQKSIQNSLWDRADMRVRLAKGNQGNQVVLKSVRAPRAGRRSVAS